MQTNRNLIYKNNSDPIKIKNENTFLEKNQYSLKQNFFDPEKKSPPNVFMIKLYARMVQYESNYKNNPIFENK
jgi:hypothetical protein